ETGQIIPPSYLLLAGPPVKSVLAKPSSGTSGSGSSGTPPQTSPQTTPDIAPGGTPGAGTGQQGQRPPGGAGVTPGKPKSDDLDDDDDDDEINDPLAHLFEDSNSGPGKSTVPIIGVAPKLKGQSIRLLYGLDRYEDWVFIYLPDFSQRFGPTPPNL